MAEWSPYNYVFGNPILFVDPDGRAPDNIGVDNNGAVVFDDGKNDGNIFLVNDEVGEINSLEELESNSTQLAQDGNWIAGEDAFDTFIKSQVNYINDTGNNVQAFTAYFRRGENQPYNANASVISTQRLTTNGDGSVTVQNSSVELFINPTESKLSNIHDLRFTLSNELFHLTRPNPQNFGSRNAFNNYIMNNVEEIQSSVFQMSHWTVNNASNKAIQSARKNLNNQIRIGGGN